MKITTQRTGGSYKVYGDGELIGFAHKGSVGWSFSHTATSIRLRRGTLKALLQAVQEYPFGSVSEYKRANEERQLREAMAK